MTWVSAKGIEPPGLKVTTVMCMSWRRSAGSMKRVVPQAPSVSGIIEGGMSCSCVMIGSGLSTPLQGCHRLRHQWNPVLPGVVLRTDQGVPGGT